MIPDTEKIVVSARELVSRYGPRAIEVARENVEYADRRGDMRAKDFAILVLTEVERATGAPPFGATG